MARFKMKDGNVYNITDKINGKLASLYRQLQFLNTRIVSYETVLSSRKAMLMGIWNPRWLKDMVDAMQLELLKKHDEDMFKAKEKAKQEALKPKLSIISPVSGFKAVGLILIVSCLFGGCVSMSTHKKEMKRMYDEGYEGANFECVNLQKRIKTYIESLQERLRLFNQVDPKGELYPLKPEWKGHKSTPTKGNEGWQK
jgi:hypothetical protein